LAVINAKMNVLFLACLVALVAVPAVHSQECVSTTDKVAMFTKDSSVYKFVESMGLCLAEQGAVQFWLKASNDAHITLRDAEDNDDTITITIGSSINSKATIKKKDGAWGNLASARGTFLDKNAYKAFWVSWTDGKVIVGTGTTVGQNDIMTAATSQTVNFIGVSTDWLSQGAWAFGFDPTAVDCGSIDRLAIYTPDKSTYRFLEDLGMCLANQGQLQFWVQASNDVHVTLTDAKDNDHSIELEFGIDINTNSIIQDDQGQWGNVDKASGTFLDKNAFKPFWITWGADGEIIAGRGTEVGADEFLRSTIVQQINFIGIYTNWFSEGRWAFGYDPTTAMVVGPSYSFAKNSGHHSEGAFGLQQDDQSLAACQAYCASTGCYAIDYDYNGYGGVNCWVHTSPVTATAQANVDQYVLN